MLILEESYPYISKKNTISIFSLIIDCLIFFYVTMSTWVSYLSKKYKEGIKSLHRRYQGIKLTS